MVVTNPGSLPATNKPIFTITNGYPTPTVSSIAPSSGINNNASQDLTVNGGGFRSGATVKLTQAGQSDITPTGAVNFVSASQLTCTLDLANKVIGAWNVVVTNPDQQTAANQPVFTIDYPAPTITSLSPSSATAGGPDFTLTVNGAGFVGTSKVNWGGADNHLCLRHESDSGDHSGGYRVRWDCQRHGLQPGTRWRHVRSIRAYVSRVTLVSVTIWPRFVTTPRWTSIRVPYCLLPRLGLTDRPV